MRALLLLAAERAERAPSTDRAVRVAWSTLHSDHELMSGAFDAWCRTEHYLRHPSGFGAVLRRRYHTAPDIGASLRRAAEETTA